MLNIGILTISDKGSRGEREDVSGKVLKEHLPSLGGRLAKYGIVPDEALQIAGTLKEWADSGEVDVILTTGGTGLSARDVTPEATLAIIEKAVPGLPETMRARTLAKTPFAMLSRAVAGVRRQCLIINLPGSPKAVRECLEVITPVIPHAVQIINGEVTEHAPGTVEG